MTREKLLETKKALEAQRIQAQSGLDAIAGGLQTLDYLLAEDAKEHQAKDAVPFSDIAKAIETGEPVRIPDGAVVAREES